MDLQPTAAPAHRTLAAVAVLVLVLGMAAAPSAAQSGGAGDDSPFALAQTAVDADAVLLSVDLQPDGDAVWRIEYRIRLDDENTTAAFEELQAEVEANSTPYVSRFEERLSATVADASSTTGRDMALRNASVSTTTQQLPQTYGVLVYRFEWTQFAVAEGDQLRAGDALAGLFLDADSSLLLAWPEGYSVEAVSPEPDEERERSVVWRGPTDFGPDEPTLVLATGGTTGPVDTSFVGLAVVVLVLVGGGALWWWRYRPTGGEDDVPATSAEGGSETDDGPPEELLSNEERVVTLIEDHGGRMKQQAVVEELGWTDAKTSQVVGKLRDAGEIEGFRLGRENVLRLPEVDDSPAPGELAVDRDDDAE